MQPYFSVSVCGDDECTADIGETCETCARDCCPQLPIQYTVGITFGVIVFIGTFVTGTILITITAVSIKMICYDLYPYN